MRPRTARSAISRVEIALQWCIGQFRSHPVRSVFIVALLGRVATALVISVFWDGSLFYDDWGYLHLASEKVKGDWITEQPGFDPNTRCVIDADGIRWCHPDGGWASRSTWLYRTLSVFLVPLTFLLRVFGTHTLVGQIYTAFAGATATALVTSLLLQLVKTRTAIGAGVVLALYPSQVMFSAIVLKDPFVWMALAFIAVAIQKWDSTTGAKAYLVGLTAIFLAVLYLTHLRVTTMVISCYAITIALALFTTKQRAVKAVGALMILLFVPILAGSTGSHDGETVGIAGHRLLVENWSDLSGRRAFSAQGANTGVVSVPSKQELIAAGQATSGATGSGGGLAEEAFQRGSVGNDPPSAEKSTTILSDVRGQFKYLPWGLKIVLFDPHPGQLSKSRSLLFPLLEHLIWYPIIALAFVGIAFRREYSSALVYVALVGAGTATTWALVEGNLGGVFRHRGEFVWAALIFAARGFDYLVEVRQRQPKHGLA